RAKCAVAGVEWKTLVFGSVKGASVDTSAVFRADELLAIRDADVKLQEVGRRMRILDERNFPEPSLDNVLEELSDLKAHTGAKRALVVVDALAAWPAADDVARVGQLKALRDALDGDPVVVVCEAKRGVDGSTGYPDGLGTARGARTADLVLV